MHVVLCKCGSIDCVCRHTSNTAPVMGAVSSCPVVIRLTAVSTHSLASRELYLQSVACVRLIALTQTATPPEKDFHIDSARVQVNVFNNNVVVKYPFHGL